MNNYSKLLQHKLLTKAETYELIKQFQNTSDSDVQRSIEEKLIRHNFKLIFKFATNFFNNHSGCTLDDCIQVAMLSVKKAIEKFDLKRELAFSTYMTWWLKSYLQRDWQKNNRLLYLPMHVQELYRQIQKCKSNYEAKHNCSPSISYIAEQLDTSVEKITDTLAQMRNISSLNTTISNDDGSGSGVTELLDLIQNTTSNTPTPDDYLNNTEKIKYLNTLLNTLNESDREILILRYGLNGNNVPMTLNELSLQFNLTREAVRGKVFKTLTSLKRHPLLNSLKEFN